MSSRAAGRLRIATRGSRLALAQSELVAAALRATCNIQHVEFVVIRTTSDRHLDIPIESLGGKDVFTREIDAAVLRGEADMAVHSLKDLPVHRPDGLLLAAVPHRANPFDVLAGPRNPRIERWREVPLRVGTSSLRRTAQLRRLNPKLEIVGIRGNVPTRVRKAQEGEVDAVALAAAGLERLGETPEFLYQFTAEELLPAPGQGAIGVEIRAGDERAAELAAAISSAEPFFLCRIEREFLRLFGGSCRMPLGAYARRSGGAVVFDGFVASPDGSWWFRDAIESASDDPTEIAGVLATLFEQQGARVCIDLAPVEPPAPQEPSVAAPLPLTGRRVVVTRDEDIDGPLSRALLALGAEPVVVPLVRHSAPANPLPLLESAKSIHEFPHVILTSARAVSALTRALHSVGWQPLDWRGTAWCVGPATAERARADGFKVVREPGGDSAAASAEALLDLLTNAVASGEIASASRVLFPVSERAGEYLVRALAAEPLNFSVAAPIAYRTTNDPRAAERLRELLTGAHPQPFAITLASASAAESLLSVLGPRLLAAYLANEGCIAVLGAATAAPLRAAGLTDLRIAARPDFAALAESLR